MNLSLKANFDSLSNSSEKNFFQKNFTVNWNIFVGTHKMNIRNLKNDFDFIYNNRNYHSGFSGKYYLFNKMFLDTELYVFFKSVQKSETNNQINITGTCLSVKLGYCFFISHNNELNISFGYGKNYGIINTWNFKSSGNYEYFYYESYNDINQFYILSIAYFYNFKSNRTLSLSNKEKDLKVGFKLGYRFDIGDVLHNEIYSTKYPRIISEGINFSIILGTNQ